MKAARGQLVVVGLLGAVALANACPGHSEDVRVTVVAILATDQDDRIDPKLACMAKAIQQKDPKLTGFRRGVVTSKPMEVGEKTTFELTEGRVATITLEHGPDARGWVGLRIEAPQAGRITYEAACGKCFPIITGYRTKKHEQLIIAVQVETCGEE
jgi:hypothetical protein